MNNVTLEDAVIIQHFTKERLSALGATPAFQPLADRIGKGWELSAGEILVALNDARACTHEISIKRCQPCMTTVLMRALTEKLARRLGANDSVARNVADILIQKHIGPQL